MSRALKRTAIKAANQAASRIVRRTELSNEERREPDGEERRSRTVMRAANRTASRTPGKTSR